MSNDGELRKIIFAPGINKNTTDVDNEGKWVDADKIRFRYGKAEKIGGWVRDAVSHEDDSTSVAFTGIARDILPWIDLSSDPYMAIGTHKKVEILYGGQYYDVTPIRTSIAVSSFHTSIGSTEVIASVIAHGAAAGDYVVFTSTAASLGGITLAGEYEIKSITDANTFVVSATTTATATTSGGATSAEANFLLPTGQVDNTKIGGWGTGTYGTSAWGTTSATNLEVELRQWSLDNWGEDLLACPRGGKIYWWDKTNGLESTLGDRSDVRLVQVTAAPTINNFIMVGQPGRHLISFGCTDLTTGTFDPMLIRWSHVEDFNIWDPTVSAASGSNEAGDKRLRGGNKLIGAVRSKGENVVFTDDTVYSMRFVGNPFIYSFNEVGNHAGLVGQQAAVDVNGTVYWMSSTAFHRYRGTMETLPCTLQKAIFPSEDSTPERLNFDQKEKTFCGVNSEYNEIIWVYPAADSTECDRYVIFNYLENVWYDGTIDRTVWVDKGIFDRPYACGADSILYIHENGKNDDGSAMKCWIQSSDIDISDGEQIMFSDKFVPDFKLDSGRTLNFTIQSKKYPEDPNPVTKGPYTMTPTTQKVSYRIRGRNVNIKYSTSITDGDFHVGAPRINIMPDGGR